VHVDMQYSSRFFGAQEPAVLGSSALDALIQPRLGQCIDCRRNQIDTEGGKKKKAHPPAQINDVCDDSRN
jgi:hypothetical protein